ncbi:MAG: hypothetical protein IPF99_26860 [Deltaproteobacteria bacterium]|nr:hypothetical protein [Deltaproteobacteria bacterium]
MQTDPVVSPPPPQDLVVPGVSGSPGQAAPAIGLALGRTPEVLSPNVRPAAAAPVPDAR